MSTDGDGYPAAPSRELPQGDALSQELVRQQPGLAGRVHYLGGAPWCDGVNHTTMCGDEPEAGGVTRTDEISSDDGRPR